MKGCPPQQSGETNAVLVDRVSFVILREIAVLKELNHPAVVKLLDVVIAEKKLFLVFEHLDKVRMCLIFFVEGFVVYFSFYIF